MYYPLQLFDLHEDVLIMCGNVAKISLTIVGMLPVFCATECNTVVNALTPVHAKKSKHIKTKNKYNECEVTGLVTFVIDPPKL